MLRNRVYRRGWFDAAAGALDSVGAALNEFITKMNVGKRRIADIFTYSRRRVDPRDYADLASVPPGRFELPPLPPEGSALSPELWGPG